MQSNTHTIKATDKHWKTPSMPNSIKTSDNFSYNFEWDGEKYIAIAKEKEDGRQQ